MTRSWGVGLVHDVGGGGYCADEAVELEVPEGSPS